jgi:uncharacterized membrane protein YkoI
MWVRTLLLSAIVAVGAHAAPVAARPGATAVQPSWVMPVQDRRGERGQDIRSLREVVDMLRARHGGELISARLEQGSRPIYVIRWRMPDGSVRDFRVDAAR